MDKTAVHAAKEDTQFQISTRKGSRELMVPPQRYLIDAHVKITLDTDHVAKALNHWKKNPSLCRSRPSFNVA